MGLHKKHCCVKKCMKQLIKTTPAVHKKIKKNSTLLCLPLAKGVALSSDFAPLAVCIALLADWEGWPCI
jgi:hypothetical protein